MRKFFLTAVLALILSVPNFCGAVTVSDAYFNNNEKLIYPVVSTENPDAEKRINHRIIEDITGFIKQLQYEGRYSHRNVLDARTSYEVACNEDGGTVIFSLILTKSYYFEGAAHPQTSVSTLNYNMSSGTRMGKDYFLDVGEGISEEQFLRKLERALRRHCADKGIMLDGHSLPLKQIPENFYWDKNCHLHFIFNHYEVAPYAAGIIDVDIDA